MLELKNVSKQFKDFYAVKNMNQILENGVYGLLGPNGAGKTTLMRILCTLLVPTEGHVLYNGTDILHKGSDYRRILGYLPQDFGYYPEFSAEDYLLYIASLKGLKYTWAKKKVREMLDTVSLTKVRNKKIKTFSGGMKRRLGIAQSMLNDPKVLILDEPTAGLDPKERIRFRNLISQLSERRTVLLSTHIVSDVENIANEILLMNDGQILTSGTVTELCSSIEGKVWHCTVPRDTAEKLELCHTVQSRKADGENIVLELVSDQRPTPDAVSVTPALEDVYLLYFGSEERKL